MKPDRAVYVIRGGKEVRLQGARAGRPAPNVCDECGGILEIGDFPLCKGDPGSHSRTHRRAFKEFEIELDGVVHRITSIQDANRLEKESWQRYNTFDKNGKRLGSPSVLRLFHQNRSNYDVNTLDSIGEHSRPMRPFNSRGERTGFGAFRPRDGDR